MSRRETGKDALVALRQSGIEVSSSLVQPGMESERTPLATTLSLSTHLLFSPSPSPLSTFPSVLASSSTSMILALSSTLPPPISTPPVPLITARNNATAPASYRSYAIRFAVYCAELDEEGRLAREGWRAREAR